MAHVMAVSVGADFGFREFVLVSSVNHHSPAIICFRSRFSVLSR
jgi:hypothetical protein